jgi:hypothetical protein
VTALRRIPVALRWIFVLGLLGLALTVPHSAPDGTWATSGSASS